jgi:L-iditol 2-dehydrogenase
MNALVLEERMRLALRQAPDPRPGTGEVLVRIRACGICGSDVHGMDGSTGRRIPPIIMGHEASGIIQAVGAEVVGWAPGDRVTFDSTIYCGECWYCARGRINLCDRRRVLGVSCADYRQDGAFAEYVAVPSRILYRLPEGLSFERAAMVEALSVALHAVRITPVGPGDTAVVVGAGMIGLLAVQALRSAGCTVVAIDVEEGRCEKARLLGADRALLAGPDATREVRSMTGGRGADAAFEVVGSSAALATALASLRKGGSLTLVGNLAPVVDLGLQAAVTGEITIRGSCASCWEYPACLSMIARNTVNVDALISAVAPLAEGPRWFKRLYEKEKGLMKVILVP